MGSKSLTHLIPLRQEILRRNDGSIHQWPLPSQAGTLKGRFSLGELPSIGQDCSPASQLLAQLLVSTPKTLPLTEAEGTPNLDRVTAADTTSLCSLECMVGKGVLKSFHLGETLKRGVKSGRRRTTQPQGHQHVLDGKRHLVSPPGPGPSKRPSTHSLSFLQNAGSFLKAASLLATLGALQEQGPCY